MFTQPWYPTKSFPHPLSNMSMQRTWSKRSRFSYLMVDEMMWIGLGYMINEFRSKVFLINTLSFSLSIFDCLFLNVSNQFLKDFTSP